MLPSWTERSFRFISGIQEHDRTPWTFVRYAEFDKASQLVNWTHWNKIGRCNFVWVYEPCIQSPKVPLRFVPCSSCDVCPVFFLRSLSHVLPARSVPRSPCKSLSHVLPVMFVPCSSCDICPMFFLRGMSSAVPVPAEGFLVPVLVPFKNDHKESLRKPETFSLKRLYHIRIHKLLILKQNAIQCHRGEWKRPLNDVTKINGTDLSMTSHK